MQRKSRYVKPNTIDFLLLAVLVLLVLTLLLRGVLLFTHKEQPDCTAQVEFVVRDLDQELATHLATGRAPFYLAEGGMLAATYTAAMRATTVLVRDENGNLIEVESPGIYKVTVSFLVTGKRASDGTFLLHGVRRLATGDSLLLTCKDVTYQADVIRVDL